jgi:hypothetical protein
MITMQYNLLSTNNSYGNTGVRILYVGNDVKKLENPASVRKKRGPFCLWKVFVNDYRKDLMR